MKKAIAMILVFSLVLLVFVGGRRTLIKDMNKRQTPSIVKII